MLMKTIPDERPAVARPLSRNKLLGTSPTNELFERFKYQRLSKSPIHDGMVPTNMLLARLSDLSSPQPARLAGSHPVREFVEKSSDARSGMSEKLTRAIGPDMELFRRLSSWREDSDERDGGKKPEKPLECMAKCSSDVRSPNTSGKGPKKRLADKSNKVRCVSSPRRGLSSPVSSLDARESFLSLTRPKSSCGMTPSKWFEPRKSSSSHTRPAREAPGMCPARPRQGSRSTVTRPLALSQPTPSQAQHEAPDHAVRRRAPPPPSSPAKPRSARRSSGWHGVALAAGQRNATKRSSRQHLSMDDGFSAGLLCYVLHERSYSVRNLVWNASDSQVFLAKTAG
uniref:Uncharacterized protein n=1 Tax=Triticum urartu TaxID=4572 RepID=A0A8R7Q708_TRIUA